MCIHGEGTQEAELKHILQGHTLSMTSQDGFLATQSCSLAPGEAGSRNNSSTEYESCIANYFKHAMLRDTKQLMLISSQLTPFLRSKQPLNF